MADLERAKVLIELRRLGEAREQLAAVLAAEPDNAEAATYLAQAAYLDQRYREAAAQSATALSIQPRNQFAMRIHALALLNTGPAGRWEAQRVAAQVVAFGPEFAENHRIQAIVLRESGNLPAALEAIDRAVELDPDEADIHIARGSILRRMGRCGNRFRPGPAVDAYRAALRLEPENAYAVHDLAIAELNGRCLRSAMRGVLAAAAMDPALGDLVRTNTATVIRHAVRRMHWVLTVVAFVTLVLGGVHRVSGDTLGSAPIHAEAVVGSHDYFAPRLAPLPAAAGAPDAPAVPGPAAVRPAPPGPAQPPASQAAPAPGSTSAQDAPVNPRPGAAAPGPATPPGSDDADVKPGSGGPVPSSRLAAPGPGLAAPGSGAAIPAAPGAVAMSGSGRAVPSTRAAVTPGPGAVVPRGPGAGPVGPGAVVSSGPGSGPPGTGISVTPGPAVAAAGPGAVVTSASGGTSPGSVAAATSAPGAVGVPDSGSAVAPGSGPPKPVTVSGEVRTPTMATFPAVPGAPNPEAARAGSVPAHGVSRLGMLGRGFGAAGLAVIVVVSLWWFAVVPWRRRRFVLAAAWASPPTALRAVVFGVGLIVCAVGVASGLRIFLSIAEPALLALGIIMRRIA